MLTRLLDSRAAPPRTHVEDTVLDLGATARPEDVVGWLLADVRVGAESLLEITYLRDVERAHGLTALVTRQLISRDTSARRDVWYPDSGVVVELDGRRGHTELGRPRDVDRDLAALDGLTLRLGAGNLHGRPCSVAVQVARGLERRGWTSLPTRCRRCALVPDRDWA